MRFKLTNLEIFLLEFALFLGIWLMSDYLATLLTVTAGSIVTAVLVIALISEAIERSKVPRRYFYIMALSIGAMLSAGLCYMIIFGGSFSFLEK